MNLAKGPQSSIQDAALKAGDKVWMIDSYNDWHKATIIAVFPESKRYLVRRGRWGVVKQKFDDQILRRS